MKITPEDVAYWYFRLNGCLTIPNFVVHPDHGGHQQTDVDVIAVRFPYREELLRNPMRDDGVFLRPEAKPLLVIAEVKKGMCSVNRAFRRAEDKNLARVVQAVGIIATKKVPVAERALLSQGMYEAPGCLIVRFFLGKEESEQIAASLPGAVQITWAHAFQFISERFHDYRSIKYDHKQWDEVGKLLWNAAAQLKTPERLCVFFQRLWDVSESI